MPTASPAGIAVMPLPAEQALALDARHVMELLADPSRAPRRWAAPGFAREVELVRAHLRPIRSRAALAASFGREAFNVRPNASRGAAMSAVQVAYATRWLELSESSG